MKIYALVSDYLILYVGKTNTSLKQREASHRTPSNTTCSKDIPDYMDWEVVLVDEIPDDEATQWEQHYYDELMPLYNRYRPGQTDLEYNRTKGYAAQKAYNKRTGGAHARAWQKTERGREYSRSWYHANKKRILEQQKEYRNSK
jgi:hypothetical protein